MFTKGARVRQKIGHKAGRVGVVMNTPRPWTRMIRVQWPGRKTAEMHQPTSLELVRGPDSTTEREELINCIRHVLGCARDGCEDCAEIREKYAVK